MLVGVTVGVRVLVGVKVGVLVLVGVTVAVFVKVGVGVLVFGVVALQALPHAKSFTSQPVAGAQYLLVVSTVSI